ncbi:MAG: RNA-binding S4 domain-containing protein [Synergistaceae bacterium]|jgi:ribosomal 50S subunit-recycling heat shock protein|nr:RNA-binding S4 domain-containing protein [Synergistaceae bacterium]
MRADKFLKLSRLVKRRTVAQEMIEAGVVRLGGRAIKPASEVRAGDLLEIAYPSRTLIVSVICDDESSLKRGAEAYELREERRRERGGENDSSRS